LNVPQVLAGRYAIEREIGRGGMAVVYLARDLRHIRDVAVKVFQRESDGPDEASHRFLQEIQIAARLSHPNILPLHDSGEADGILYYVMPFVPGETLRQRLEREGALPVPDALAIATEIAGALAYAHSHGVIHRDIKPENILFIAGHAVVADFGIARAISAGGWDEWKLAGPAGTPTYMSPEQARGGSRVDGRSDLYSLGCVLYEMLTGEPPFRGRTPEEVVVQHLEAEPLPVHSRRPTLTPELQAAVGQALAKHPADRYQTAQQMADALGRLEHGDAAGRPDSGGSLRLGPATRRETPPAPEPATSWVRRWAAPAFAAAGIAFAIFWTSRFWPGAGLDPSLHLVAPFVHRAGVPMALNGDQCSRLVHEALTRWQDVRLADPRWTTDQIDRLGHDPTLDDLFAISRRVRAGRLISGEVWSWGDSVRVRGALYDVRRGREAIRQLTVTVAGDLTDAEQKFAELADSLLLPQATEPLAQGGVFGTRLLTAWQAYDSGHAALARWDLDEATRHFRSALALDPRYGLAHLWLAQTLNWQGEDADAWRDEAKAGLEGQPPLGSRDKAWGTALLALAEGRYQDACGQYDAMVKRDTVDFQGWYGRGECRRLDRAVVRDAASPSGWRYRASYHAAIGDFERALTLIPSTHRAYRGAAFGRLTRLFYAEANMIRLGYAGADSQPVGSFPALAGDTIAFIPYPMADLVQQKGPSFPASIPAAVKHNRERLSRVASAWARAFPSSSTALEAYGRSLELEGRLAGNDTTAPWALTAYRHARTAREDSTGRLQAGVGEVRVLVKLGRYPEARALADTLLLVSDARLSGNANMLAGLAALTGRPFLAAELVRRAATDTRFFTTDGREVQLPLSVRENALGYLALAAFQAPVDSLRVADHRLLNQVDNLIARPARAEAVNAVFAQPRALAYPVLGATMAYQGKIGGSMLLGLQDDLVRGDTANVRRRLAARSTPQHPMLYSEIALDQLLRENQILLQIGDTLGARTGLERTLDALPASGLGMLGEPPQESIPQAAAVPLLLALSADLAADRGDRVTARRLAAGALALIDEASLPLRPVVDRLHTIALTTPQ
jgi:tetratricopeptide (TPR) repeat protein